MADIVNAKERMRLTMHGEKPDRVPVMCQLSLGHIYKNCGIGPLEFWYSSKGLAEGFIQMAERYKFDGILISVPGINPSTMSQALSVVNSGSGHIISWKDGNRTFIPANDDPRSIINESVSSPANGCSISDFDLDSFQVIESESQLPDYFLDIIDEVKRQKENDLSIHGSIGTAFENFMYVMGGYESGLMALLDDPGKCIEMMYMINCEVIIKTKAQCARGVDAMDLSSPIAGSGFISRSMYEKFVLPFEREVIQAVKKDFGTPCYIHTCGKIGDRLDLIVKTGTDGIECLDPEPLGDVNLEEAVDAIGSQVFVKGNLDSVNELYGHTPGEVMDIAKKRIEVGMKSPKGYILSSACSVSPLVPVENVRVLFDAVNYYGRY
jgi:uroporphyrinogen-III decarboxylase